MRSHEARPCTVPPNLELWGGAVNTAVPPVKTLEGTVPPCSLPHVIYATAYSAVWSQVEYERILIN